MPFATNRRDPSGAHAVRPYIRRDPHGAHAVRPYSGAVRELIRATFMFQGRPLSARRYVRLAASAYRNRVTMITICARQRRQLFGVVRRDRSGTRIELSVIGDIVREEWFSSPIETVALVIMPDHVHGIVRSSSRPLSIFIRGFKSAVASRVYVQLPGEVHRVWQRGYNDRILRAYEIDRVIEYVRTNPDNWQL